MKPSEIDPKPEFFDRYIHLVGELDLMRALGEYSPVHLFPVPELLEALGDQVYAPGKWTVKQIIQHCIDTERIMSYRALRFARNDQTNLPGFDENTYADNADVSRKTIEQLLNEFKVVRMATFAQFLHLDEATLRRVGTASEVQISVGALGFVVAGHALHHRKIIDERYLPLLNKP